MFGEICSSGRAGKVSQTKYGYTGCAFLFSPPLVHRPDSELCKDSHLDVLVKHENSDESTQGRAVLQQIQKDVKPLQFC